MLDQIKPFSLEDKIVDFVKISENLSHYGLSPKICKRLWDSLKKKLKDLYKRENEFQALCRNEVNLDFWTEGIMMFKRRVKHYEAALHSKESSSQGSSALDVFQAREQKAETLIESFFTLFKEPSKLNSVMEDLNKRVREESSVQVNDKETQSKIDSVLNELLSEISVVQEERVQEILNPSTSMSSSEDRKLDVEGDWTTEEIASLIRGVFRFGENEWQELL
jgi:vacuolar-type H+-ATPase subunit I/STV1